MVSENVSICYWRCSKYGPFQNNCGCLAVQVGEVGNPGRGGSGDNDWAGLVISFEKVVFLIHVSGSFILTKPKWDQILSAFKIGEIISCYRGFQMDWSSLHLWVGAALYSCKSEQILETKEQEKWSKVVKSYWITFVCILVLFDFNGCRAISESHILPDGLLGRLCCGNAGSRLALFIGCFMGQT